MNQKGGRFHVFGQAVLETKLPGIPLFKRGKVRDLYDLGEHLLIVATDRISAFDVVLPTGIPEKGAVLTQLSAFWFEKVKSITPSHLVSAEIGSICRRHPALQAHRSLLAGRSMLVEKAEVVPMECVVRGYLSGSGWKEYRKSQAVCGVRFPPNLKESQELEEPIFTPATKEETGHDVNITREEMAPRVGESLAKKLEATSISIYAMAQEYARSRGILIADTKFEFGLSNGKPILIDELLTPDSSRFWPVEGYAPGRPQASFDKQFVRDYLESLPWDKAPPGPPLPDEIVEKTCQKYMRALAELTGKTLPQILSGS
ncbi:MAG: phosphoribosylaminoimidazolesuccinocarboxamide synthase [Candidatus Omnitrophica bacterium]|nr:phosphoribosylaminoimidazolesuccinocarboxamide synthase [Candidatus Omnitrophota bacterium]